MNLRELVAGADVPVPVRGGTRPSVQLDNAASTPPFRAVVEAVAAFAPWYANVHRGMGYKSRVSTDAYEAARAAVHAFVGGARDDVVVFTRNTTEALNLLAARLPFPPDAVVLTTRMEHHSNDLPWRRVARVAHVALTAEGAVDEADLRRRLAEHHGRVALLAVTAASNVTGLVNPVHRWARLAHAAGARIVVDAAQLVPHRPLTLHPGDPAERLDWVAFSAHKMYAPFGIGVLAGAGAVFAAGAPLLVGGGAITTVDTDRVTWAAAPEREEAGTPCVLGAVALHAALRVYAEIGWARLRAHEQTLLAHARRRLAGVPGLTLYGGDGDRVGVLAFNLEHRSHALVAAALAHEYGIATRNGCFCAHPYLKALLGLDRAAIDAYETRLTRGDRTRLPGAVRASIGLYNTAAEIDRLADALTALAADGPAGAYVEDPATGAYVA